MYSQQQIRAIAQELRDRFVKNTVKDHEIVITLLTMEKAGKITANDIADILLFVYFGNKKGVQKALDSAKLLASDALISEIISEVEKH